MTSSDGLVTGALEALDDPRIGNLRSDELDLRSPFVVTLASASLIGDLQDVEELVLTTEDCV